MPASPAGLAFFLDVDGTLIDIAPTPDGVVVPPDLPETLAALAMAVEGAVAIVSGRAIISLDGLLGPSTLVKAGLHGGELRRSDGAMEAMSAPPALELLRPLLTALVDRWPGTMLEDKGAAIAVHYRGNPAAEPDVLQTVEGMLPLAEGTVAAQRGKMVIELKPATAGKGNVVRRLMAEPPFAGRRPVAIGDDITDEAMFAVANAMGGLSIRVGSDGRPTEARQVLPDTASLRAWVAALGHVAAPLAPGAESAMVDHPPPASSRRKGMP
ncbi:MAG: trehalose-phosphatase [Bauldia sp.]|nr:trehalose-phosphatase [Bauldia sp.]MCW5717050.1 trehalose-phosphatase [Bauldia sp.]